ncbi:MAG: hypothetical protein F4X64_11340 [Chloroflexi bacterium]|nr:hypothetical protein [Chloroflexota bacterium]
MTTPNNPVHSVISDADWQRLSTQTRGYAVASFELMNKAHDYLRDGDLRQASEKGWGAAAQMVKAVAENWKDAEVVHGRHQDLRALVAGLAAAEREPGLDMTFHAAQDLHENFYEDNLPQYIVDLDLRQVNELIIKMAPQLRRSRPPRGFRQGR